MHKNAIEARFPHFITLFNFDPMGQIISINKDFTWQGYDGYTIAEMIIHMTERYERGNIEKHTDVSN